jgi:O-antigen ligase
MKLEKSASLFAGFILASLPIAFYPVINSSFVQGKELFFRTSILILLAVVLVLISRKDRCEINDFTNSKTFRIIGLLTIVTVLSAIVSDSWLVSIFGTLERGFGLVSYGYVLLLFLFLITFIKLTEAKILFKILFGVGVFLSSYAISQRLGFDPLFSQFTADVFETRSFAFIGNPTLLGQYLAMIFFTGFTFNTKFKNKTFLISLLQVIIVIGIFATEARAAILSLVIGLIVYMLKFRVKLNFRKIVVCLLLIIGCFYGLALSNQSRFSLDQIATRSVQSRLEIWSAAYSLIKEKPLFGYGPETFYIHFPTKVDKDFFELEEDLNSYADRVHNEFLAVLFSIGIFGGLLYLALIINTLNILYRSKSKIICVSSIMILVNFCQNQLGFIDLNILVLLSFLFGLLVVHESKQRKIYSTSRSKILNALALILIGASLLSLAYLTVIPVSRANWYHSQSKVLRTTSFKFGVLTLKESINHMPFYAQPWYDLLVMDPSSSERALKNIKNIEGESPTWIAWTANSNRKNLSVAEPLYIKLLELNHKNPHWVRAYADAQYINKNYEEALKLYKRYLDLVPEYWKWKDTVDSMSAYDQKRYRIFFKNNPDFWNTVEKVEELESLFK